MSVGAGGRVAAQGVPQHHQHANNAVENDHGRLKARLRPMRGLKQDRSARLVIAGHALIQNLRRGHYELGVDAPAPLRLEAALAELASTI